LLLHRIWWLAATALLIILVSGCGSTGVTSGGGGSSSSSLSASQSSLQFGSILVGTPTSQTLTFTNSATSSKNVVVTAVSFGGANSSSFSLLQAPALPLTITPGQTVSVVIQALATVAGPLTATMTVTSDATSGSVNVALSATATLQTFSITGSLGTAGAGANVALSGTSSGAIVADASGNFSFGGLVDGSYTIPPSKSNITLTPASQQVRVDSANLSGINFTETFSIVGSVGFAGSGASITLSGAGSSSVVADGSGNFLFAGLANGSYTVTPSKGNLVFAPASQTVAINNASVTGVNFTGGGQLVLSPANFTFNNVALGTTSAPQTGTLTASGASVIVNFDTLTGAGFGFSGITFPLTIASGQSVNFSVTFTPAAAGNTSGSLAFDSNAMNSPSSSTLAGTGSGLVVAPGNLNFGSVLDGTISTSQIGTLTAVGVDVTISSVTPSGSSFSVTGLPAVPFTITSGQSMQYSAAFAPPAGSPGPAAGSVAFASSANGVAQTLSGSGASNVALSWSASTTPNVTYKVYRCSISSAACVQGQPGNFTNIAGSVASLTYTDAAVSSGQTYYYALTAVDGTGVESVLSTVTNPAAIP